MNAILLALLLTGLVTTQVLFGGSGTLAFSLPGYLCVAAASVLSVLVIKRQGVKPSAICLATALLLAGVIATRAWFSPVPYLARMDLFMVGASLLVYLITALHLTAPRWRLGCVAIFLVLAVVQTVIGVIQFRGGENFMLIPGLGRPDYGWRASGFYGCPNHFAGFIEIVVLFGASVVCWSRWPAWAKILTGWVTLLCVLAQLIAGSRGGYLSLLAGLGVFAVASVSVVKTVAPHRLLLTITTFVFAGLVLTVGVIALWQHTESIGGRIGAVADTTNMRLQMWAAAWEQSKLEPLIGTGAGTYIYYARLFRPPSLVNDPINTHNDYLHLLAEYGVAGAAAFLLFLGVHVVSGVRSMRRIATERLGSTGRVQSSALAFEIGALSVVAAYMVHSIFDFNLHIPVNTLIIAFVFGILANSGLNLGAESSTGRAGYFLGKAVLPIMGAVILFAGIPLLQGEYFAERARKALDGGQYTLALGYAQKGIALETSNPDLFYYLGWAQYQLSRERESEIVRKVVGEAAVNSLERGVALWPQDTRLQVALAHVLRRIGRFDESEIAYKEAMRWDPNSSRIRARYGHFLKERGDLDGALAEFKAAQELNFIDLAKEGIEEIEVLKKQRDVKPENRGY